ncbi:MAG TPA: ATP-binding protein [Myxococcaceae bacterium]|nr:ATP-binding protein [Myxococcaceae bacterium]
MRGIADQDEAPVVLYVDDEMINLRVFEANFRTRFNVVTAQSAAEALEVLSQRAAQVAVLISDQRMPGMSGVELLERARDAFPDVRRMLITAYSDMQAVMDAVNRGQVVRYFVKPWVKDDLAAALEDAIRIWSLQLQVREIEGRMLRSERLAALGQVSAGIAHELMNPVGYMSQNVDALRREVDAIRGAVGPMLERSPNEAIAGALADLPGILDDVETAARHIREVALSIRSQARGEDEESRAQLADAVNFAVRIARAEIRQKARVLTQGEPVMVALGQVKLCQVLINLIVNSAHAIDPERPGRIEVRWWSEGDLVRLDVADNGVGIPPELHQKVFEPLFTTKPVGTGTGLGLAICRDILQQGGGELRLESKVGEGTTMQLTLPPYRGD